MNSSVAPIMYPIKSAAVFQSVIHAGSLRSSSKRLPTSGPSLIAARLVWKKNTRPSASSTSAIPLPCDAPENDGSAQKPGAGEPAHPAQSAGI